jgi:hypothetical protein
MLYGTHIRRTSTDSCAFGLWNRRENGGSARNLLAEKSVSGMRGGQPEFCRAQAGAEFFDGDTP